MKSVLTALVSTLAVLAASAALAAPKTLTPANPQPGGLKKGLSVIYAEGGSIDIKFLKDAEKALAAGAQQGRPLRGLDYRDTTIGEPSLTSNFSSNMAASISGYIRFDQPGVYKIDFYTNDGLRAIIGGQRVGHFDGRQTCDTTFQEEVQVPQAGWYKLDALYFNRMNTSCLMMRWAPPGQKMTWVPNSVFGH